MKAVRIHGYGGPEVVKIDEVAKPSPSSDQVLVRVSAAGVNPVDWKIREGYFQHMLPLTLPATLGTEVSGTVESLASGVTGFAVGDRVHASVGLTGGLAEYALVKSSDLVKLPTDMDLVDAAAVPLLATTVMTILSKIDTLTGTRILLNGASGGVGSLFIQVANRRGARIVALTSAAAVDYVRGLGAEQTVARREGWQDEIDPVDVVIDTSGTAAQEACWPLLKPRGLMISIAAPPSEDMARSMGVRATLVGAMPNAGYLTEVDALMAAGLVRIPIAKRFPLDRVDEALAANQIRTVTGKILVIMRQ